MFGQTISLNRGKDGNLFVQVRPGQPTPGELRMLNSRLLPSLVVTMLVLVAACGLKGWLTWGDNYVASISYFGLGLGVLHLGNRLLRYLYGIRSQFKLREPKPQTQQQPQQNQQNHNQQRQQQQNQQKQHHQGGGQQHQNQQQRQPQQQGGQQRPQNQDRREEPRQQAKFLTTLANPVS